MAGEKATEKEEIQRWKSAAVCRIRAVAGALCVVAVRWRREVAAVLGGSLQLAYHLFWSEGLVGASGGKDLVECSLCHKHMYSRIKRLKQHLTTDYGDVAKCSKTTSEIMREMQQYMQDTSRMKKARVILDDDVNDDVQETKERQPSSHDFVTYPSFGIANSRSFEIMVESIGQMRSGLKPPSFHELRLPLLEKAKQVTDKLKEKHTLAWKEFGCTLMSDGWTDRRGRQLINFLANSLKGTFFLELVDALSEVHDATILAALLEKKIEEIGKNNVVQIVSDNGANYKAVGRLLEGKILTLFWTPCAAHCLDLMLEDIGKLREFKSKIAKECIMASHPLFIVLRIVGGDTSPAMPELAMAMLIAKKKLNETFASKPRFLAKLMDIVEGRWEDQMEVKLYGAAFQTSDDVHPVGDLSLRLVDEVIGASNNLEGCNLPTRAHVRERTTTPIFSYLRRHSTSSSRTNEEEQNEEDDHFPNDDEEIEDDDDVEGDDDQVGGNGDLDEDNEGQRNMNDFLMDI
ncbi:uncharacterized protein LOC116010770 [Ipomoea triloba]|uniref:uncharacterized protein LOC116010770 n=1 Tax=Ipomoea triloba TaxID=35885 RepID=UPI00125D6A94|nr:uncharacterized protein LOC116010770 [Ipomoea triloba]